jgi:hypothetical protein
LNYHLKMIKTNFHTSFASILHYKSEYCLMDILILFPQSFIRVWFFWESKLQHKCAWWLQVLWKFWIFWKFLKILKFYEILWKLKFLKILQSGKFWNHIKILKLLEIFEISEFSLIDDEGQVFRINTKLLSNPVTELKICENHSHCWSIVLKTMDRSIVKQLEREKNSNFDVENFVVMFIYWGTII